MSKTIALTAFCPQLPAAHAWQESAGTGSTLSVAIGRAIDRMMKSEHVKGKRITGMKFSVQVVE
jgi:hypothetical protein